MSALLEEIHADYQRILDEYKLKQVQVDLDMAEFGYTPQNSMLWHLSGSPIHGLGVFASQLLLSGTVVGAFTTQTHKTPLGRYMNHSPSPNCLFISTGQVVTIDRIVIGKELTVDYRANLERLKDVKR